VLGFPGVTSPVLIVFLWRCWRMSFPGRGAACSARFREKRALAYRVSAFSLEGNGSGYFAVYVATAPRKSTKPCVPCDRN